MFSSRTYNFHILVVFKKCMDEGGPEGNLNLDFSYFNEKELEMLKRYTKALIENHSVSAKDIGIIAPYIRQVRIL